jgi:OOP family OmpA-OmpF porin
MELKKWLMMGVFALSFVSMSAQEPAKEVFKPHAYLQLQGGGAYTLGETSFDKLLSPAAQLGIGYQFCPVFSTRLAFSGWKSRGAAMGPDATFHTYSYSYVAGNVDFVFNMVNLIWGYKPHRAVDFSLFLGGGGSYGFNNDDANNLKASSNVYNMRYLWDGHKWFGIGRGGVIIDFNVSKRVAIELEGNANITNDHYNSKYGDNPDWYFNALAGIKIALGKTTRTIAAPVVAPAVEEEQATPAPVEKKEEVKPAPVEKKYQRCDIFFTIGSSKIRATEIAKLDKLAEFLKANPEIGVNVTGYADKGTGTAKVNQIISKERANRVTKELINRYGIETSRITTDYKGDTVQPFSVNNQNRVTICVAGEE